MSLAEILFVDVSDRVSMFVGSVYQVAFGFAICTVMLVIL